MTVLFIVRHGNTFAPGEAARRIGARTDLSLVASGQQQAAQLGRHFADAGLRFTTVLAAPLRRTVETARLLLAEVAAPPTINTAGWLNEIDYGLDENVDEETVSVRIGAAALAAWDREAILPPGWQLDEPVVMTAWRRLFDAPADGNTLIVTSNGIARFALRAAGLVPPGSLKLRTGSFGRIDIKDGRCWLVDWDRRPPIN